MKKKQTEQGSVFPTLEELEKELNRERSKKQPLGGLRSRFAKAQNGETGTEKRKVLPSLEELQSELKRERQTGPLTLAAEENAAPTEPAQKKSAAAEKKPPVSLKTLLPGRKGQKDLTIPPVQELEKELKWERYKDNYLSVLRSTIYTLITVSAVAVLVAVLLLPVLQIYGTSMTPTLYEGNIVVSMKGSQFETGDVIAFYYNNRILVKRVIAQSGEWVDIDEDGVVSVNREVLNEPYVSELAFGECDIDLPYQVPESRIFVLGDHRSVSVDSRSSTVGCIAEEQIVGKIVFRVWPLEEFGVVR